MAEPDNFDTRNRSHIPIDLFRKESAYTVPPRNMGHKPLREDYAAHASQLLAQLSEALDQMPAIEAERRITIQGLKSGSIVEVTTIPPNISSRTKTTKIPLTLEFPTQDIVVLRSERNSNRTESALLFVPDDARSYLKSRIIDYGRDPINKNRPNIDRFEVVEEIRATEVFSLFSNKADLKVTTIVWWELWIRQPINIASLLAETARNSNIDVHTDRLTFPDTTVLFVHANVETLSAFVMRVPGAIIEVRRATGTIEPFLDCGTSGIDQHNWVEELAQRVTAPLQNAPVVCTLDTGVAAAHPLIALGLQGAWAYDAAWGADDHHANGGHGTPLAGLVLFGDLEPIMNDSRAVLLTHGVESMKLLPPHGFPPTKPPSYGVVTQGAVSSVEIQRPSVVRSFCIAASSTDFPPSRPSTWSGAIDQIASGAMPGEVGETVRSKRLLIIATGNVAGGMSVDVLPSQSLEDPAQSWNALTIGGFTRKEQSPVPPPVLQAVVPANHRSPFSRGSQSLPYDLTPIKPEVLFEAGNMLSDALDFCGWHPSVSLLSTGSDTAVEPLVPFWATSAAAGMAGNFVGRLQAAHPDLWPETHRALMVDSARWPEPIRKKFVGRGAHWKTGSKSEKQRHLREFGYGVPDIERAIFSAQNESTMIAQSQIQPFAIGTDGKTGVFNEMHFYDLPWPKRALEQLENEIVTMKVTLSYFVEPNLTGKAATRPDTYRSFGLRFDIKKRGESDASFQNRITAIQKTEGPTAEPETSHWLLGPKAVQAGSLHCDLWRGRAIDLASHDAIAIYPVGGWWKSRISQKRITDKARYALVISISAQGHKVDLYSEITALVEAKNIELSLGLG